MPERVTRERWTYGEFARLPSDGNRYEVIAGELFVSAAPRPSKWIGWASGRRSAEIQ